MFIRTTAINKIRNLNKFVKGVQGGTSAGKTYGIIPILIDIAAKSPNDISIVAESIPHLKRGAMKDFKKIMQETGRWFETRWNASDFKYNFANGSSIEFFSADTDAKLRGARRDYLYMNECNNMTFHSYTELASRTKKGVYLDWNPTNEFWFHEHLMNDNDVDFLVINYMDNEACPESALNFINKAKEKAATSDYWANWYKVYGLGEIGSLQGSIFEFNQVDNIPLNAEFISYGLDWGFTNDPTSLIEVYRYNGELYINELIYSTGLTNSDILKKFSELKVDKNKSIVADSAEPKSIEDIYRGGYTSIRGANKGKDSVINSIDTLKQFKLNITKASTNLIKELRSYVWERDKEGKTTNNPIDYNNHAIDALRYVALNKINKGAGNFNYMLGKL
jgi:phage terminase large subunit